MLRRDANNFLINKQETSNKTRVREVHREFIVKNEK